MSGFTSVTSTLGTGTLGQLAYGSDADLLTRSYVLQDSVAIGPGKGVVYDATHDSCMIPTTNAEQFLGVAYQDESLPLDASPLAYSATLYPNVPVVRKGQVWVLIGADVTPADPVYMVFEAGGTVAAGGFMKTNDGGHAVAVKGCQWAGVYTAASGIGLLQLNQPAT